MIQIIKNHLLERFIGYFEATLGGLLFAMLLGDDAQLSVNIKHYFSVIGMQHVVAASGFNVGMILALGRVGLSRFWGLWKVLSLVGLMVFYVILAGNSSSLIRASTQASIVLIGTMVGKQRVPAWWALLCGITLLSGFSFWLWEKIGFQLSVGSTVGVLVADTLFPIHNVTSSNRIRLLFLESAQLTASVQVVTFPLLWYHFGSVSMLTLPANTLLLWLTPFLTYLSLGAAGIVVAQAVLPSELFWQPMIILLKSIAWFLGGIFISTARYLAQWESSELSLPVFNALVCSLWYVVLIVVLVVKCVSARRMYKGIM